MPDQCQKEKDEFDAATVELGQAEELLGQFRDVTTSESAGKGFDADKYIEASALAEEARKKYNEKEKAYIDCQTKHRQ